MRLIACTFSAVLLSGCSWMGFGNNSHNGQNAYSANNTGRYSANSGQYGRNTNSALRKPMGPCQITAPTQPIPRGCRPEQVTLALGNGGQSQSNQGQYTSGNYGSHAGSAYQAQNTAPERRLKKPKLRGQLGLEIDHSVGGDLYAPGTSAAVLGYNRATYAEGFTEGSVAGGAVTSTTYTSSPARLGRILSPNISFDDVYTAPLRVTGGLEYILGERTTVFANAGYTRAEGKKGGSVAIDEEILQTVATTTYITDAADGVVGTPLGTLTNTSFIPNETVATFGYEFNELEKYDFEVGGRHYFKPMMKDKLQRSLSPFVSASGGLAHYGSTTVIESQQQRYLQRAFVGAATNADPEFYDVSFGAPTQIYDAQWVAYGALKGGLEWQMTPKTSLAFEAGVKYETARDFSNGTEGDNIISIPVAIRGSYNF